MANLSDPPNPQRTILLSGRFHQTAWEGRCRPNRTIIPGMLVEQIAGTGGTPYQYPSLQPHGTAAGQAEKHIAVELGMVADVPYATTFSGGTIDDAYAAGDLVFVHQCRTNDIIYGLLKASGAAVTLADTVESAGDGTFKKTTAGFPLFKVLENITPGATPTTGTRIRLRAL